MRVWNKLLGLLLVVLLAVLTVSSPRTATVTEEGTVTSAPLAVSWTEKDVTFAAGVHTTGETELTLVLQPGETALLDEFTALTRLDATGSTCYEELVAWSLQHPEVELRFTVELPVCGPVDWQTQTVDLTGLTGEDVPLTAERLAFLPALQRIELGSPDAGTRITAAELEQLRESVPGVEIHYTITLLGQELDPETTETLDLTSLSPEEVESAAAALSGLPKLTSITLAGGEEGLSLDQALLIAEAAPNAVVDYPAKLYGKSFNLSDPGLDLNHIKVDDEGEAVRRVLPCMRACTWLDMDSCGVDNEHMAVIRDENPNVEVIWRVWFGTNYSVRTNVTKILASMPTKGGYLDDRVNDSLKYCTKVRYLDLGHNNDLVDFDFVRYMPDLEVAVISMTGIEDLSPFASCPNLLYLEMGNTHVSDLSPLAQCKNLCHLNIGTNINITDISPLYELDMKRLWIGSYTPVPAEQVAEMQERHPGCIVNTTVPSGIGGNNEGYVLEGWKSYQNYLTVDWNYYSAHHAFPAQRPIGWYKVIYKCFEYNLANGAYAFSWNDPLYKEHGAGVKPVNTKVIDTSFLKEDWEDPGSIVPDVLSDPPGETISESER